MRTEGLRAILTAFRRVDPPKELRLCINVPIVFVVGSREVRLTPDDIIDALEEVKSSIP